MVACPQHALLSQSGIWLRLEHVTELSGDHAETALSSHGLVVALLGSGSVQIQHNPGVSLVCAT